MIDFLDALIFLEGNILEKEINQLEKEINADLIKRNCQKKKALVLVAVNIRDAQNRTK